MKLIYITNSRLPTEKAHGVQISKMCEEFMEQGVKIELICPKRKNKIKEDFFKYYNLKNRFKLTQLKSWDLVGVIPRLGFRIQSLTFAISAFFYLRQHKGIIYSRDQFSSTILFFNKNIKIIFELHNLPEKIKFYHKFFLKRVYKFIAISQGLKNDLIKLGIKENKILVAPDGVDIKKFKVQSSKFKVRDELNLPMDKKIILYSGHLYGWKGADLLLKAANNFQFPCLPDRQAISNLAYRQAGFQNFLFVFVGGTEQDIKKFKNKASDLKLKNVLILGHQPHAKIPYYLKSADVLVLPNSKKEKISKYYTSPLKLFEYMASEVPIIASNLPSIKEILNKNNAIFFQPDNSQDLAEKIKFALQNNEFLKRISIQAKEDIKKYTWQKRTENIIKFIKL